MNTAQANHKLSMRSTGVKHRSVPGACQRNTYR